MISVPTDNVHVDKEPIHIHVSQCVAVSLLCKKPILAGAAHVHPNSDIEGLLSDMVQRLKLRGAEPSTAFLVGGANSFVPGYGRICGEPTAVWAFNYLCLNLHGCEIFADITGDLDQTKDVYIFPDDINAVISPVPSQLLYKKQ